MVLHYSAVHCLQLETTIVPTLAGNALFPVKTLEKAQINTNRIKHMNCLVIKTFWFLASCCPPAIASDG